MDSASTTEQVSVWHALPRLIMLFVLGCVAMPLVIAIAVIGLIAKWVIE